MRADQESPATPAMLRMVADGLEDARLKIGLHGELMPNRLRTLADILEEALSEGVFRLMVTKDSPREFAFQARGGA